MIASHLNTRVWFIEAAFLAKARHQFATMTTENARRLLRFWQVRSLS